MKALLLDLGLVQLMFDHRRVPMDAVFAWNLTVLSACQVACSPSVTHFLGAPQMRVYSMENPNYLNG